MARGVKYKKCLTVGALKKFIADIPDRIPIRSNFDEQLYFTMWERETDESGPKYWFGVDEEL